MIEAEPWLESLNKSNGHDFANKVLFDHASGDDCILTEEMHMRHSHDPDEDDHSHDLRPLIKERAAALEGEPRPGKELYEALSQLLVEKKVVSQEEIRDMSEPLVVAGKKLNGASLIARAWTDAEFEERLLSDAAAAAAAAELGFVIRHIKSQRTDCSYSL